MEKKYTLYDSENCIRTFTGKWMNVFKPTADMIDIRDIAHALSCIPRFAGHLPKFYSVAQHSIMCADNVEPEFKLAALLHDASEAYLLDIPRPIKGKLTNYKEIEDNLMTVIAGFFGFEYPMSKEVKDADNMMLQFEWDTLMLGKGMKGIETGYEYTAFTPEKAESEFLSFFEELRYVQKAKEALKSDNLGNLKKAIEAFDMKYKG